MSSSALHNSTDYPTIDNIIRSLIDIFEMVFPGHIRGHYLTDSYADGSVIPTRNKVL